MKESKKRRKAVEGSEVKKKRDVSERDSEHDITNKCVHVGDRTTARVGV